MLKTFRAALEDRSSRIAQERLSSPGGLVPCTDERVTQPDAGSVVDAYCVCGNHKEKGIVDPLGSYQAMEVNEEEWDAALAARHRSGLAGVDWGCVETAREEKPPQTSILHLDPIYDWSPVLTRPGMVSLFMEPIQEWFHRLIAKVNRSPDNDRDDQPLARLCLEKVLFHELFHYFCDVWSGKEKLEGYREGDGFQSMRWEEPLANAYSRRAIGVEYGLDYEHGGGYMEEFVDRSVRDLPKYYEDWVKFRDERALSIGICEYLPIRHSLRQLRASGIDVPALLLSSIDPVLTRPHAALILWWPRPDETGTTAAGVASA